MLLSVLNRPLTELMSKFLLGMLPFLDDYVTWRRMWGSAEHPL